MAVFFSHQGATVNCGRPAVGGRLEGVEPTGEAAMIARLWRGRTPPEKADAYEGFLSRTAYPDYGEVVVSLRDAAPLWYW